MKIRLDVTAYVKRADGEETCARFKRMKKHAKKIGQSRLAALLLTAIERDLDPKAIGFKCGD
jgi:hypothetical protein